MRFRLTSLALLASALSAAVPAAFGQYLWIDDKGVKQLSDRPPPPSVPAKRILKAPGKPLFNPNAEPAPADADGAAGSPAESGAANAGPRPAPTLAARNEAFNKRRADAAAAERKAADDVRQKADIAANCDLARQNQRMLEDGVRMANVDKNGERGIMGDQERAEFGKKNQKVLAGCQ
ncbi:DUF4124 domain-containing protein [Oxalobacteraceae bacterium OTU3CINTB1]|nr:DUF4124 domain-containing protein [Oxalobacteraceae bacterium OTU3CINTB1]